MERGVGTEFLCDYCNCTQEEANSRVKATIDEVQKDHHVYKCIEHGMFANPRVDKHPLYKDIKGKFNDSDFNLLELGCCFGTDARKMIHDGLSSKQLTVSDLLDAYWLIGQNVLFKDNISSPTWFVDFSVPIAVPNNLYNAINAQAILHCLSKQQVCDFLTNAFNHLKKNGVLFGNCAASKDVPKEWSETPTKGLQGRISSPRWLHNKDSLTELLICIGFVNVVVQQSSNLLNNTDHAILIFSGLKVRNK